MRLAVTPSPDEARDALRRELLRPEYREQDVVQQVLGWLDRRLGGLLDATAQAPRVSTVLAMVVLVVLLLALGLLLSRARRTARTARTAPAVLTDEVVTAARLRERAEQARAEQRWADAVVDGFRALAVGQVERGVLDDTPGATAAEVARTLVGAHPAHAASLRRAATLFDAVLYGHRPATEAAAADVLALDREVNGAAGTRRARAGVGR